MFSIRRLKLVFAAMAVLIATSVTTTFAAEVTLKAASCFPIGSPPGKPFEALVKAVNEQGAGVINLEMVGGAPAIGSPFTLTQKMARGAYDVVGCTEAYFGNVIPEGAALRLSERTYAELRENGGIDYMQDLFAAKNLRFLARHHDFGPFFLWLNKPITEVDLSGLHLRVSPVYTAFFKSLGATVQTSNIAQVYTYMENNTVQGYGWPALGWVPSWIKVTKYRVEPGFYNATLHTLVNLTTWNRLTAKQKDLLESVATGFESRGETTGPQFLAAMKKQKDWMASEGMKTISFEGAEADAWLAAATSAAWREVRERSPEHGPALQKLFTR